MSLLRLEKESLVGQLYRLSAYRWRWASKSWSRMRWRATSSSALKTVVRTFHASHTAVRRLEVIIICVRSHTSSCLTRSWRKISHPFMPEYAAHIPSRLMFSHPKSSACQTTTWLFTKFAVLATYDAFASPGKAMMISSTVSPSEWKILPTNYCLQWNDRRICHLIMKQGQVGKASDTLDRARRATLCRICSVLTRRRSLEYFCGQARYCDMLSNTRVSHLRPVV